MHVQDSYPWWGEKKKTMLRELGSVSGTYAKSGRNEGAPNLVANSDFVGLPPKKFVISSHYTLVQRKDQLLFIGS